MSCTRTRQMLDAWIDGELDAGTSAELGRHASACVACKELRDERAGLRSSLKEAMPRHVAPATLGPTIVARIESAEWAPRLLPRMLAWWQALLLAGASAALAVVATVLVLPGFSAAGNPAALAEELVARHTVSLAGNHLIDVASSDRHTVKPWFQGKVDFAPQVRELASDGYGLEGARLEQVAGRPAVAVVYRIRKHPINLFVWRGADARDAELEVSIVRGFSVAAWATGGLRYVAVSDTDSGELKRFAQAALAPR